MMQPSDDLQRVCRALDAIGIKTTIVDAVSGFLPGVRIVAGGLHIQLDCRISSVLHEAGHLATIPARYRTQANDNLKTVMRAMWDDIDAMGLHPDAPLARAAIQCSDPEATAWAYAFGVSLGLAPEQIIQDDEYPDEQGNGTGAEIRDCLRMRTYSGINGLAHAGFCSANRHGRLPQYPQMACWTQTAYLEAA